MFQISPIFEKFSDSVENCQHFTFSRKIFSIFIRQNFWLPFFISPYFPCFGPFPPCFAKIIIPSPTLTNFPSVLEKFTCFLHTFSVFRFPPTLTMMHLYITKCTNWTPLVTETKLVQMWWGCLQGRIKGSTGP